MGRDGIHKGGNRKITARPFCIVSEFDYAILFNTMNEDKRVSPRFLFSEPVAYTQPEATVNGSVAGNISLSGMSLRSQEFIPVGFILELQIRLGKSPKVIWVKAKVARVRKGLSDDCYEIGLKFIKDEECIKAVGQYINACRYKSTNQIRS